MVKVKNKKGVDGRVIKNVSKKEKPVNPFEIHFNKEKFNVIGRKGKNDKGLPGVSRAKALKKRKNTLGLEYDVKYKNNKFVDGRIGELNSAMTYEDRINARFTAERVKQHKNKKDVYKLADDEVLTHRGQTLEEIEKFEDLRSDDEFSDDDKNSSGRLEDKFVADAHFGGGLFRNTNEEGVKSRKDIIDQLIADSKKRKVEKQKEREVTIEMTEKLDKEWKDLLPLVNKKIEDDKKIVDKPKPKADDYDILMRTLIFEPRGTPSDRLKKEDELAQEEKAKLEKLENDRLARMHGQTGKANNKITHRSADDLDDDFELDDKTDWVMAYDEDGNVLNKPDDEKDEESDSEEPEENRNLQQNGGDISNEESIDDDDDDDMDSFSDMKSESSDIEEEEKIEKPKKKNKVASISDDFEEKPSKKRKNNESTNDTEALQKMLDNLEGKHKTNGHVFDNDKRGVLIISDPVKKVPQPIVEQKKSSPIIETNNKNVIDTIKSDLLERKISMEKAAKELPYTFKMPEKCEDLEELLIEQPADHHAVILERILKCNHPSLAQGNKEKLETLTTFLLQYINDRFTDVDTADELENSFKILDRITTSLYDLCLISPKNAYTCFTEVIKEKFKDFMKSSKKYPGLETIVFLKLISLIFPTSDFRHQVVTPALIFISQMLTKCRVRTNADIAYGLFLVSLTVEWGVLSNRFVPEALNFLCGILHMAIPKNCVRIIKVIPPFKSNGEFSKLLVLTEEIKTEQASSDLMLKTSDFIPSSIDDSFKIRAINATLKLLVECFDYLKTTPSCQELFASHLYMLELIPTDNYPEVVRKQFDITIAAVSSCKDIQIDNLVLDKKRPKALRLYEPTIVQIFDSKVHKPMSQKKAETAKLMYKLKQEKKGAIREIRRDKAYIGNLKIKKQMQSDIERKAKVNKILAEASVQQCEFNKLTKKVK